ncbi:Uroporphyrin-III C-methyltransferase [Acidithiobacillus ferrivorans]|uniref:uroporphyrinogen-III C-methyltransferase n=1 Tax=Acidithiobacillus ferrivorans TaxID=160808 RepID=A0A060UW83_9PROT|nr:uroporphyrinogen-III C-methyltransferase [Acidithiobacillus ferrivorans]CDQ10988.1 Uroporphyrin-III C-methyltransferase [Acidithiobacillus ferrivorans]SMH65793.1 Uroporphyrin-III C-methyltransferase [Acidithiobacillus ferrivorans]
MSGVSYGSAGKVWIVGAGPGDPELLTLKAATLVGMADIIFHDALVNIRILAMARPDTQLVNVGKRGGQPSTSQVSIHTRMIHAARQGMRVVRLKGGDPFIFGRGGEECIALWTAGIDYEVVPGITSGSAAAAAVGVPLTYRTISQSVLFVTGHAAPGDPPIDWAHLAKAADTLVIYMGLAQTTEIQGGLIAGGRHPDTPVLAVHWVTLPQQRHVCTRLNRFADVIHEANLGSPTIIIVGESVRLSQRLSLEKNIHSEDLQRTKTRNITEVFSV